MTPTKNHVLMQGVLGFDPEIREIAKNRRVARMSVATSDTYKNLDGETVTDTQWHTVVAWGDTADAVAAKLKKGSRIELKGRRVHRSYTGKDGAKRYITEIVMSSFSLLP